MRGKTIILWFFVVCFALICMAAGVLVSRGGSVPGVLILSAVLMAFIAIPILGAARSLHDGTRSGFGIIPKHRARAKLVVLFVISPLAVGVIVLLTYPTAPSLSAGLSVAVMLAASVFYFLID